MINKKIFLKGVNNDDSYVLMDTGEYLNALNIRFSTSENGKVGQISNVEGNSIKNNSGAFTLPSGTNTTIGAWEDTPNRRVFFFNKNSSGSHGIYCYDADNSTVYTALLSTQVVGGLNFSSPIHSVSMVGNLLYWTDGVNPQRRINVEAGIKLNHVSYTTDVSPYVLDQESNTKMLASVITLIRNQPAFPLTVAKGTEAGYASNFISNEAFQFAYRFVYRDFEVSVFSPLSTLINYHNVDDVTAGYNRIDVTIPTTQKIPQDVIRVEVAAKYVIGGKYSIVKSFTTGFSAHNTGTALTFKFFNDSVGVGVDDPTAYKQFDSIPIRSGTLEIGKNRLFLGNNYDGYQAPSSTSLTVSKENSGGAVTGTWVMLTLGDPPSQITVYLLDITGIGDTWSGYYAPGTYPATTYTYNQSDFRGAGLSQVAVYYGYTIADVRGFSFPGVTATVTGSVPSPSNVANKYVFKSDSSYKLGVVFFDQAGRKCGTVVSDNTKFVTQDRSYNNTAYTTKVDWLLVNNGTPSILQAEIPDWAHYYTVVMTKSLRTNFFMQMRATDVQYAIKANDGTYTYSTTYLETRTGIAVKVDGLNKYGMGYSYQEGDVLKLYGSDNTVRSLKVKDTYGDYVIVDLANLGTIVQYLFEIYTPYAQSVNEFYYEKGVMYPINNPGLSNRSYSTLSGSFTGDVILLDRTVSSTNFIVEAMSPMDLKWQNWNTNIGRTNIVSDARPALKKTSVYWSNVIVPGTQTNGMSTFDALDQTNLPIELNSIQKLQLVSKVESEGTVMLAIGEQETASIYLGEAQIIDNTGNSFLATSSGVIGNVNVMRGSFGTINPESVVRYMGNVYWFDANKGSVVSYSPNGLFPISSNKMMKYFRKVGQDVIGSGLKFYGGIDPYHNEVLMFSPRKSANPAGARLTDMALSSSTYSFTTVSSSSTVTVVGDASYTYTGSQIGPNQATVTGSTGAVTFTYSGTGGTAYGPSSVRPSQVGSYQVVASVASDGIYDAASSAPFAFAIATQFVFDADYMLLTYQFTDGFDLDTRTRIVTPNVGQDAQPKYVGWGVSAIWPTSGTPLLDWGGDNTGTGFESVLINVAQLKASYPSATTLVVDLRAFWYSTVGVQPVNVAATLWKGGSPIEQGPGGSPAFSFTNPTATAVLNISSVGKQITSDGSPTKSASSGERVATLTYNLITNTGSFNSNDTTTPSV
jgi:hypothetical protein